jgi:hypothetical protein
MNKFQEVVQLAISRNRKPQSLWFQMATIGLDGLPKVRTLAFRGFLDNFIPSNECFMVIAVDKRSRKVKELQKNDKAEICWYFAETREQLRITIEAFLIHPDLFNSISNLEVSRIREKVWESLSNATRAQYLWPTRDTLIERNGSIYPEALPLHDARIQEAFANFAVILARPTDCLKLDLYSHPALPIRL